jgi:hypothetical protein
MSSCCGLPRTAGQIFHWTGKPVSIGYTGALAISARRVPGPHQLPTPTLRAHSRLDSESWPATPTSGWPASGMPGQRSPAEDRRLGGGNQRGSGEVCAVKIRGEWNYQNRLERLRQRITLPNHDGPAIRLFPRSIRTEVSPPDLASLQLRSFASSALAHSARPCSARGRSSPFPVFASLAKSQRPGSGRRTTIMFTRSPGRRLNGSEGRSTPFPYWASTNLTTIIVSRALRKVMIVQNRQRING